MLPRKPFRWVGSDIENNPFYPVLWLLSGRPSAFVPVFAAGLPWLYWLFAGRLPAVCLAHSLLIRLRPSLAVCVRLTATSGRGIAGPMNYKPVSPAITTCPNAQSFLTDYLLLSASNTDSLHYYIFVVNFSDIMLDNVPICSIL